MNTQIDIEKERAAARLRLDELRSARGANALDGKRVDHDEIVKLENLLAQLADAESELTRRERVEEAERRAEQRAREAAELLRGEETRLEAIAGVEAGCREMVRNIACLLETNTEMRGNCRRGDFETPLKLGDESTAFRVSALIAAILATIPGHRKNFGTIQWFHPGHRQPGDDWVETERRELENELKRVTKGFSHAASSSKNGKTRAAGRG